MHDLTTNLRATTQDLPPTAIDLDGLITRETRRARRIRMASIAGGIAATATVAVMVATVVPSTASGPTADPGVGSGSTASAPTPGTETMSQRNSSPSVSPSQVVTLVGDQNIPCGATLVRLYNDDGTSETPYDVHGTGSKVPTEDRVTAAERLSRVLSTIMPAQLPYGPTPVDALHRGCEGLRLMVTPDAWAYFGTVEMDSAAGTSWLSIVVLPSYRELKDCALIGSGCQQKQVNGLAVSLSDPPDDGGVPGAETHKVLAVHTDGTAVMVQAGNLRDGNHPSSIGLPLTEDQLTAIATEPAFTLYP